MRNPSTLAVLAAMVFIAGCNDTTEPGAAVQVSSADAAVAARAVERVQGGGNFIAPDGDLRTFAFSATRRADGSVTGQWERIRRFEGNASSNKSHGVVTCFTVVGHRVWLGGYATSGIFTEPGFNDVGWVAVDNGNGRSSTQPDRMSLQLVSAETGTADFICNTTPKFVIFDLTGNVIIH